MHLKTEPQVHEANPDRTEERKSEFNNSSWRFQHSTFNNGTSRQKTNREIEDLNNTINKLDLTDICTTLHTATVEYTCFCVREDEVSGSFILMHMKLYAG